VLGIGFPAVRPSSRLADVTIISERGPWKEEAGLLHGVTARQDKMRVLALLVLLWPQVLIIVPGNLLL